MASSPRCSSRFSGCPDEQGAAEIRLDGANAVQTVPGQFGREFIRLKTVFARMDRERAEHPRVQHVAGNFLEQQQAAGPKYSGDFAYRFLPVGYVMDDPEVDDCVDGPGRLLDRTDVADR
jgi:hypothetical protein